MLFSRKYCVAESFLIDVEEVKEKEREREERRSKKKQEKC
jgi:hypothetical protein